MGKGNKLTSIKTKPQVDGPKKTKAIKKTSDKVDQINNKLKSLLMLEALPERA